MEDLGSYDAQVVKTALAGMVERIDLSARSELRGKRRRVVERKGVISFKNELALSDTRQAHEMGLPGLDDAMGCRGGGALNPC